MHFAASLLAPVLAAASSNIPYEQYIFAPKSRDLIPPSVYSVNGSVTGAKTLTQASGGEATFYGVSSVTYDFGKNVAGLVSLDVGSSSSPSAFLGVTFSESSLYINNQASDATADAGLDAPLWFNVGKGAGQYTPEDKYLRGGFRYLTIVSNTTATVSLKSLHMKFTAAPDQDLRAYTGYFHSDDELINKIWYAGAYTNQLATINPKHGNSLVHLGAISSGDNVHLPQTDTWWNNYTITNGSSTITDGAKRDRLVWPGDMSIALETIAVSTGDLYSVRTALESLFVLQKSNGQLPYAGKGFRPSVSYTYHLHSLIGASYLYRFSGEKGWLSNHWSQYKRGLEWAISSVDETGLANITSSSDWLRFGMGAHNIEANAILYFVLQDAQSLATELNDKTALANWSKIATKLKAAANEKLWDASSGLYFDNETTTMHPQDGNAWAIKANLTQSTAQAEQVSNALKSRWGKYGAPAPEAGKTVSPFISGFELQGHYIANKPNSALDLIRLEWGFMLNDPRMTQSTFIEGYSTDGSLHYAPYTNDARVSHAHGWSTGPTYALTAYAAGIQLTGAGGSTWVIAPQAGNLTFVDAGFETAKGKFSTSYRGSEKGVGKFAFVTPANTTGEFVLAGARGSLVSEGGQRVKLVNGKASGLKGGSWKLRSD
ncbi:hypothetical protein E8E15_003767 [Penicillium rubens]|uniref:Alfa-L-rhamnosidase n=1 Tax=Penicillium chrysogenum TaxID=5076 RepID=A0A125SQF0_PENCH|nr:uncharacterized protein N7525_002397 [Penicillium rubens]KAF3020754.1 hypothetical protein E8E15_003767 [Penicillium rubens]KAJ5033719.1 hypothetical protein NUH16_005135 [Penicillium rubens]KAJ5844656.1 hypothetical protein N7525_002397 [Penicillium rubens]BAU37009.1 alfa-L-rhamnosidase [Penicillium chrysogenum]